MNLFYSWKKDNIIFTKYNLFKSNKTLNGEIYMKKFIYIYLYKNKNNEQLKNEENIIFICPFRFRKNCKVYIYI